MHLPMQGITVKALVKSRQVLTSQCYLGSLLQELLCLFKDP